MKFNVGGLIMNGQRIHWKVDGFTKIYRDCWMYSPSFKYANRKWVLSLYPMGDHTDMCKGWMYVRLENRTDDKIHFRIRFSLIGSDGKAIVTTGGDWTGEEYFQSPKLINRSELEFLGEQALPGGTLNLVCEIQSRDDNVVSDMQRGTGKSVLGSKESKSAEASFKTDEQIQVEVASKSSKESKSAEASFKTDEPVQVEVASKSVLRLLQDLEGMLFLGSNSDVTLTLGGKSYKAHKAILAARSPVFSEAFRREAKDNSASSSVKVDFGNTDSFSDFIHYLYTGNESDITPENAQDLYELAVLYRVDQLKAVCLKHIIDSISIDNFCHLQTFALRYFEPELTDALEQFFLLNSKDVILTSKWEMFLNANTVLGHELLMKARRIGNA